MIIKQAELETVCGVTSKLPEHDAPEFAFAGKSNVGKSTLINGLMNRKSLARTSEKPGKTQTINFYNINKALYFVDLPGYGYARVPESEKKKWGQMVERYLTGSDMLKLIFLLVDIRHDPGENDRMMYDWIVSKGFRPFIIATKQDKIKRSELTKKLNAIRKGLSLPAEDKIFPFSAVTKAGREEIWEEIDERLFSEHVQPEQRSES